MKILLHGVSLQVIVQGSFRHRMTVEMNKEHSNFQRDVSTNLVVVSWTVLKVNGNKWAPRVVGHGLNIFKCVVNCLVCQKCSPSAFVCIHHFLAFSLCYPAVTSTATFQLWFCLCPS